MGSKSKMIRRVPWSHSQARQFKHRLAIIGWAQLIYGNEIVSRNLAKALAESDKRTAAQ